jgi:trans-aconitate 2-methyltransferase
VVEINWPKKNNRKFREADTEWNVRRTASEARDMHPAYRRFQSGWQEAALGSRYMTHEWDAAAYDRLAGPMTRWGAEVVGWLDLAGEERVLDAGCGTGKVTSMLLARLPRGRVVALDGSRAMVDLAREKLVQFGDRVEFVHADLQEPLPIEFPVDAVLSTATFHWVADHDALFRNLAAVMREGAQLAAQCGGRGNIASLEAIVRDLGEEGFDDKTFATPEETRGRMAAAGFTDIEVSLHQEPTQIPAEDLEAYLATICLRSYVARRDDARAFIHEVARRMPEPRIDYVRLNIRARRG